MAQLEFKKVNKIYSSSVHAIKDLSFKVEEGEFVVIVGPSGCGKTTILRLIAGLEEVTEGEIEFFGQPINEVPASKRDFAMVFQNFALFPNLSVYDNIALGLKFKKEEREEIKQKVEEVAKLLGLSDCLNRRPSQLSGGQKQRTALGRAIVSNPKIFLFDEPLSNLDPSLRAETRREIVALHKKIKKTFIYVTHDKTEAMTMADRLIVMREGRIVQNDTPKKVCSKPADTFTASFIDPEINFFEGKIQRLGEDLLIKTDLFEFVIPNKNKIDLTDKNLDCVSVGCFGNSFLIVSNEDKKESKEIVVEGRVIEVDDIKTGGRFIVLTRQGKEISAVNLGENNLKKGDDVCLKLKKDEVLIFDSQKNLIPLD